MLQLEIVLTGLVILVVSMMAVAVLIVPVEVMGMAVMESVEKVMETFLVLPMVTVTENLMALMIQALLMTRGMVAEVSTVMTLSTQAPMVVAMLG